MIYQEIAKLVGQYITYQEFIKNVPEANIDKHEWYEILNGDSYRSNKGQLRKAYNDAFEEDWHQKRTWALNLLNDKDEKTSD